MMAGGEHVLVFEASLLKGLNGFSTEIIPVLATILAPGASRFLPRDEVEDDPRLKQIIPYLVLTWKDKVWRYRRGKRGSESRLHALWSLGLGGHVNPGDETLFSPGPAAYGRAWRRELGEEVEVRSPYRHRIVGLINDDRHPVGQVHFGVVHHLRLDRPDLSPREATITRGQMVTLDTVQAEADGLETWSQLLLPHLAGWLNGPAGPGGRS
jgi:predicted NUDIX family phosphoesterase